MFKNKLKSKLKSKFTKHMRWTVLLSLSVFVSAIDGGMIGSVCFAQDTQIQPTRPSIPINREPEQNNTRDSLINAVHNALCQQHDITDLQSAQCARYAGRAESIGDYLHNAPEEIRRQYSENPTFQSAFLRRVNPRPATSNSQLYAPSAGSLNAATRNAQAVARNATRVGGGATTMTDAEAERIAREAQANADRALNGGRQTSGSQSSRAVQRAERDAERATRDADRAIQAINNPASADRTGRTRPASNRGVRRAERNAERALRNAERATNRATRSLERGFDRLTSGLTDPRNAPAATEQLIVGGTDTAITVGGTPEARREDRALNTDQAVPGSVPVN